ncbi:3-oxoacyl-ACP reductase FabG [Aquimarina algiphila]|uniref:3-oxoacyl-ACP reductase FabG n=1 Tax=Aquimarina algiphila TaxID=2047982 RepID=A0A554VE77_9FLAO|nr:3-oxoacyl-ACP reductase FabG [Aquimarina algiphila]TSE05346.1 3-oxoacyl-ACP reductase FabG [Aquimarina algiphila]
MSDQKKYVLVTGGSRGIGRAICIQLAKDTDYSILINYHTNEDAANETLNSIKELGGSGEIIKFDVSDFNDVKQQLDDWNNTHENTIIEVLVNNAGITKDGLFLWMQPNDWNSVIQTNLNSFYNVTNHVLKDMLLNKYGRIINIVSVSGLKGTVGQTNYAASKGAIIAATKSLAQEIAKKNVTVNAVAPGFIKTDMTIDLDEKELKRLIPANRFGHPEEVAQLVSFLASKNSSYITGEIININGGIYS